MSSVALIRLIYRLRPAAQVAFFRREISITSFSPA
jgi:hypothetical protein